MTQLFDTAGYDATETTAETESAHGRHLRSVRTAGSTATERINWRLDDETIESGRRGIAKAREALRQSRSTSTSTERQAA